MRVPSIAFLTHDWAWGSSPLEPNGCSWYRCKLPSDELKKHNWTSTVGFPGFGKNHGMGLMLSDGGAIHGWDIMVLKLIMHREILEAIPYARAMGQKIVVDVDDLHDELDITNQAHLYTSSNYNKDSNREIYAEIILAADAVITSTPFLYDYYTSKRNNVFMVRNGIDLKRWKRKKFVKNQFVKIGWVGATNFRSRDLQELSGFIGEYIKKNQLGFVHSGGMIGAPSAHEQLGISPENVVEINPITLISKYPSVFKNMDIGIVPLRDIRFNHAKSFIKGLEYAAAGMPFISSPSPEYQYLADNGIGRIARTAEEWVYHFDELRNPVIRQDEIEINYENLKKFDMEKRGTEWNETFRKILEKL